MRSSRHRLPSAVLLALLPALSALTACGGDPVVAEGGGTGGDDATEPVAISIVDLPGLDAALERRRGQGYLLNFWAIWCAPCVEELPELLEVAEAWRPRGGDVVGVSYDLMVPGSDRANMIPNMRRFLEVKDLEWEVLIYDEIDYETINARFDLPGEVPVTLAIDAEGNVVDRQAGKGDRARFEEMMRKAVGADG